MQEINEAEESRVRRMWKEKWGALSRVMHVLRPKSASDSAFGVVVRLYALQVCDVRVFQSRAFVGPCGCMALHVGLLFPALKLCPPCLLSDSLQLLSVSP